VGQDFGELLPRNSTVVHWTPTPPHYRYEYIWYLTPQAGKKGVGHLWQLSYVGKSGRRLGNEITLAHAKRIVAETEAQPTHRHYCGRNKPRKAESK